MNAPKFLQFHTLTSYPGTLLNRDDAGFAKRLPFGGATRIRVSSQCLKYHWRNHEGEHALYGLDVSESIRSRRTFHEKIVEPLVEQGAPESLARGAALALQERLLTGDKISKTDTKSVLQPDEDVDPKELIETNQITIFGEPELRYLRQLASDRIESIREQYGSFANEDPDNWSSDQLQELADEIRDFDKRELKKNLKGLQLASGLDAAMFGRMATSDVLARGDAAVHVAHAFTTHEESSESDYFSAVDELKAETGEMGGGHINSSELTSGLFYSYVVVDVPLLVSNLEGCPREEWLEADTQLASSVLERFVKLIATVSPGAKLGSTAPYSFAQCMLAEAGDRQPRTLANAFQEPVSKNGDVLQNSYEALGSYISEMDHMYRQKNERRLAGIHNPSGLADAAGVEKTLSVPDIADWAARKVSGENQ